MPKSYFHNNKFNYESKDKNIPTPVQYINQKRNVDINKLLNQVRMDKKNKTKRDIIFYSFAILALSLFSTLIMIIK
tara:strand:+ start:107 stop:334 length:228 start_codon:yes stop_codon:yes gene_type:complete